MRKNLQFWKVYFVRAIGSGTRKVGLSGLLVGPVVGSTVHWLKERFSVGTEKFSLVWDLVAAGVVGLLVYWVARIFESLFRLNRSPRKLSKRAKERFYEYIVTHQDEIGTPASVCIIAIADQDFCGQLVQILAGDAGWQAYQETAAVGIYENNKLARGIHVCGGHPKVKHVLINALSHVGIKATLIHLPNRMSACDMYVGE
jgi:hypothetical protein